MARLWLVLLLASTVAVAQTPLSVAVPELVFVDIDDKRAALLSSHVAQSFSELGARVVTARDMQTVLGLERQRQLMGCADDSSCVAELASALGVDAISAGEIAALGGGRYQLSLRLVSAATGARLADFGDRVAGDEALLDALRRGAHGLAREAAQKLGRTVVQPPTAKRTSARRFAWIPLVATGAAAGVGGFFVVQSERRWDALQRSTSPSEARQIANAGEESQLGARLAFAVAGAALVTAGLMYLFGAESSGAAGVVVAPGQAQLAFTVRLP